jgi:hypothetical protein
LTRKGQNHLAPDGTGTSSTAAASCSGPGLLGPGLLMSVEIRELRAFAVVAEEGSLSAVARRQHLGQSALVLLTKS